MTQSQMFLFSDLFEQNPALRSMAVNTTNYFEHRKLFAYLKH